MISNEEAERRGKDYDMECRTYLFDLDFEDCDCPFTVDAGIYGNVSHFVNHSVSNFKWIVQTNPKGDQMCVSFKERDYFNSSSQYVMQPYVSVYNAFIK